MKKDYVLVLKVNNLTCRQAAALGMRSVAVVREIASGKRSVLAIEKKGEADAH